MTACPGPTSSDKWSLRPAPQIVAEALDRLMTVPALVLQGLVPAGVAQALVATRGLTYRQARPEVGTGENRVRQDFSICRDVPEDNPLHYLGGALSGLFDTALALLDAPPVKRADFNDLVVQQYAAGSQGISPHRDHVRYTGLVVLVILVDGGRFRVCAERSGADATTLEAGVGDLLVMRGAGFAGFRERPFHFLDAVTTPRTSVGYRHESRLI